MQRVMEPKSSIFTSLKDGYQLVRSRPDFNVYPQMPVSQVQHIVKQAARREQTIAIQTNPSAHHKQLNEVSGKISLSPTSSHVILVTEDQQMVHLIQPQHIRHLRLF